MSLPALTPLRIRPWLLPDGQRGGDKGLDSTSTQGQRTHLPATPTPPLLRTVHLQGEVPVGHARWARSHTGEDARICQLHLGNPTAKGEGSGGASERETERQRETEREREREREAQWESSLPLASCLPTACWPEGRGSETTSEQVQTPLKPISCLPGGPRIRPRLPTPTPVPSLPTSLCNQTSCSPDSGISTFPPQDSLPWLLPFF